MYYCSSGLCFASLITNDNSKMLQKIMKKMIIEEINAVAKTRLLSRHEKEEKKN